jgi:hypothetical protein
LFLTCLDFPADYVLAGDVMDIDVGADDVDAINTGLDLEDL